MEMIVPLFILFFIGIVVMIVFSARAQKKRQEGFQALAQQMGMMYTKRDRNRSLWRQFKHFELMRQGDEQDIYNILAGEIDGQSCYLFDYTITDRASLMDEDDSDDRDTQSVVVLDLSNSNLPHFRLRPESFLDRIGNVFGFDDIDFDTHREFSKRYLLSGKDKNQVRDLFTSAVLDHFTTERGWYVEGAGGQLLLCRRNRVKRVEELTDFLARCVAIRRLLEGQD